MATMKEIINPRIYIPNFLKIRTKEGDIVPLKPKPAQVKLLNTIEKLEKEKKPVRVIILKARQVGFSTYVEALAYNKTATNKNYNSYIIAHEEQASQNLYDMFKRYHNNMPLELQPMIDTMNSKELEFKNPTRNPIEFRRNPGLQSSIKIGTARNVGAGRSQTINYLHASEVAFWQDAKTLMTGLMQTVPDVPNSYVFLESTANGVGGYFYDMWQQAERGENDFVPLFFAWFEEPTYTTPFYTEEEKEQFINEVNYVHKDHNGNIIHTEEYELKEQFGLTYEQLNWRKKTIANKCGGDLDQFRQEYPSTPEEAFIASGRPKFNVNALRQYMKKAKEPIFRGIFEGDKIIEKEKGELEIWKMPQEGTYYVGGGDVAEGLLEGDYSVFYIMDSDLNMCAKWRGHIDPDLFGDVCVKMAKMYNNAYIGIENNNHGLTTLKSVVNKNNYYNVFYSKNYDKISDTYTKKLGWSTNNRTKPLMIDKLAEFIREKWVDMPDIDLIKECLTYIIEDNGATNAQIGCHDDCVMAFAICLQVFLEGRGENFTPFTINDKIEKKKNIIGIEHDDDIDKDDNYLSDEVVF